MSTALATTQVPAEAGASEYRGTNRLLLGMCLGVSTYWLFALAITALVPTITTAFGISADELGLPISITALMSGVFIVPAGSIADKIGRVKVARAGLVLAMIGAAVCGLAENTTILTVGRALQGIAAAMIMPSTLALVNAYYKDADRLRALSFWSISSWGGGGLCNIFGGAVASYLGWRWAFWLVIPVALVALYAMAATPESKNEHAPRDQRFDLIGLVLLVVGLLTLNLSITKGHSMGWTDVLIVSGFVISFIVLFAFTVYEKRRKGALVDLSMLKRRAYNGAVISNFMLNSTLGSLMILMTYLQQGRGLTPFDAGMLTLGYTAATLVMIRVGEKIGRKFGARSPILIGCILAVVGIGMQALTFIDGTLYLALVAVGLALMGLGFGVSATPSTNIAVGEAPPEKAGSASGIYKMASSLGGSFGLAIATVVYGTMISARPDALDAAAFGGIMTGVVACVIAIVSVLVCIPAPKKN